jgi:hypothetical protein
MEPGKDFRFFRYWSSAIRYTVSLGNTENINKRSPGTTSPYNFCQNEILYSEIVNDLICKFFYIYFTDICSCNHCEAENLSTLQQ